MITGFLTTEDRKRISFVHYKNGHKQVVIVAHGFFNSKDSVLLKKLKDSLLDEYDVIMFDFRGHGRSSGLFMWTSKENLDLQEVINYAKKKYNELGLIGFSFGAMTGMRVLAEGESSVKSFISISAASEFEKIDYHFWNLNLESDIFYNLGEGKIGKGVRSGPFWYKKKKPLDLVRRINCPILYIHGDKDWVIKDYHSLRLYKSTESKKEIKIIKGGSHAEYLLRKNPQEVIKLIKDWLKKTLKNKDAQS